MALLPASDLCSDRHSMTSFGSGDPDATTATPAEFVTEVLLPVTGSSRGGTSGDTNGHAMYGRADLAPSLYSYTKTLLSHYV